MFGINNLSVIPMRKEPSDRAEMVNQILFGEKFKILEKQEKWAKIQLLHDKYEGWIDNKQWTITTKQSKNISTENIVTTLFISKNKSIFPLGSFVNFDVPENKKSIIPTAKLFLNTPYLWGGRTCFGIDCSGFTQVVFRTHQYQLLRDAYQQATQGKNIKFDDAQTNDLAFFNNVDGKIIHVGIIIKEKNKVEIIHASGKVRIDKLDKNGIFNTDTQNFSHQLHSIKRIIK